MWTRGHYCFKHVLIFRRWAAEKLAKQNVFFLRRAHDVTLRDKVRSCEIRRAVNVEPLLRIETSHQHWFGHVSRMPHERRARQVLPAKPTGMRPRGRPRTRRSDYIPDLAWSRLGVESAELAEIAVDRDVGHFESSWGRCPREPP